MTVIGEHSTYITAFTATRLVVLTFSHQSKITAIQLRKRHKKINRKKVLCILSVINHLLPVVDRHIDSKCGKTKRLRILVVPSRYDKEWSIKSPAEKWIWSKQRLHLAQRQQRMCQLYSASRPSATYVDKQLQSVFSKRTSTCCISNLSRSINLLCLQIWHVKSKTLSYKMHTITLNLFRVYVYVLSPTTVVGQCRTWLFCLVVRLCAKLFQKLWTNRDEIFKLITCLWQNDYGTFWIWKSLQQGFAKK